MKVIVAKSAGFCMGVRKAMDRVLDVSRGRESTYTIGPLVHNPQALKMLESRNVYLAENIDESLKDKTVVIRAHGVPPPIKEHLNKIGAHVVDGTCPNVIRSQVIIKKYFSMGYSIVIVGDRGHAEIDSLLGFADNQADVVENIEEARALPHKEKICIVAQTTLNIPMFEEVSGEIRKHAGECYVANTICSSTMRRQDDVRKLALETDATVVVGGRNSANTNRLAEISIEMGQPTFHIEEYSELDLEELSKYNTIGVTAGASTPQWVIKEVVDSISTYAPDIRHSIIGYFTSLAFLSVEGNFVTCVAAAALTYAMCHLMGIPPYPQYLLMSLFYLFPMHVINKYFEINWKYISMTEGAPYIRKYWRVFLGFAIASSVISVVIAFKTSIIIFFLVLVSYVLGGLYSIRIIPRKWKLHFRSIRDIPGSKDILIAIAWTFAVIVLPSITHERFPGLIVLAGAAYVFVLVFSKTTILAIGGMQSDKLVGLETIPVLIGKARTEKLLYFLNISLGVLFIILEAIKMISFRALILTIPIIYSTICIGLLSRKGLFFRLYNQLVLDVNFFLAGILTYLFLNSP
ncbi:4-hydroxy-3-methylbut-2-enyl diphosphate reductase [Candidatus Latescibacterota bacterium]